MPPRVGKGRGSASCANVDLNRMDNTLRQQEICSGDACRPSNRRHVILHCYIAINHETFREFKAAAGTVSLNSASLICHVPIRAAPHGWDFHVTCCVPSRLVNTRFR